MPFTFVMLPPHTDVARDWAKRLGEAVPEAKIVVPEGDNEAMVAIAEADGACARRRHLLAEAKKLPAGGRRRWPHGPPASIPRNSSPIRAGHRRARDLRTAHIGAHVVEAFEFVAFARDFHTYLPQQLKTRMEAEAAGYRRRRPSVLTMLIVGLGGVGTETARAWPRPSA